MPFTSTDPHLRAISESAKVIAVVGESNDHYYTSYQVAQYSRKWATPSTPVNPNIAEVDGDKSYPSLAAVPEPVDIVDVFRNPDYLGEVAADAIAAKARTLWAQLDVVSVDGQPERQALAAGLQVVSNRCIRTEHERLHVPAKSA